MSLESQPIPTGISDEKVYEIVINIKSSTEARREDISRFYISLFAVIISISPFMPKIIEKVHAPFHLTMSTFVLFISSIGIFLSIRWVLILKRINYYLHGIDNYLIGLERRNNQGFIIQMNEYLEHAHSPGRITKQQMIIPYMFCSIFMVIFAAVIAYNLYVLKT